jgi:hypothetical protein
MGTNFMTSFFFFAGFWLLFFLTGLYFFRPDFWPLFCKAQRKSKNGPKSASLFVKRSKNQKMAKNGASFFVKRSKNQKMAKKVLLFCKAQQKSKNGKKSVSLLVKRSLKCKNDEEKCFFLSKVCRFFQKCSTKAKMVQTIGPRKLGPFLFFIMQVSQGTEKPRTPQSKHLLV